jgi:hypothetical protein
MRALNTILSTVSAVLLVLALFFFVRSYFRFDGVLRFVEHAAAGAAPDAPGTPQGFYAKGKSSGLISHKGQLTYVSIVNPIGADTWEGWSVPVDEVFASGPMNLVWDVRERRGLEFGSARTQSGLTDPIHQVTWQLQYTYATAPYWLLAVLFAVLPVRWVIGYRRAARRAREGRCAHCAAPLEGGMDRCPTCGKAVG